MKFFLYIWCYNINLKISKFMPTKKLLNQKKKIKQPEEMKY